MGKLWRMWGSASHLGFLRFLCNWYFLIRSFCSYYNHALWSFCPVRLLLSVSLFPVLFCFFPPASVTLIHLSLMMLHFSTSRFALYFCLFLHWCQLLFSFFHLSCYLHWTTLLDLQENTFTFLDNLYFDVIIASPTFPAKDVSFVL